MKLSDYVIKFIEELGVYDIFFLPGGGMMHLLDSLAKNKNVNKYCNLNEQATTICCEAYARYTNLPGVAFLTTGPGCTNAITGVVDAYIDSTPMIIISGQVKRDDLMTGKNVRQFGPQECDIISMVASTTKYAISVLDPQEIRYHLEKAVHLATSGRCGPVWLEIPLDVQSAEIDVLSLSGYHAEDTQISNPSGEDIHKVYELLNAAARPVILFGNGVRSCDRQNILDLVKSFHIPVFTSWPARDIISGQYDLYFDSPGSLAPRYSNFIIQNCDFLLVIGARLNYALTAFDIRNFAPKANKVIVDVDPNELALLPDLDTLKLLADASCFIRAMLDHLSLFKSKNLQPWLDYCKKVKQAFPLSAEKQPNDNGYIDGYQLGFTITRFMLSEDIIASASSGHASAIVPMSLGTSLPNRFITAMGLGSMGYTIPLAIGSSIASGKKRVICIEGDGSLQQNLQELQLIQTYNLPVKIFVLNNNGYSAVLGMQRNHFHSRLLACNPESGLQLPSIQKLADLYDFNYFYLDSPDQMESVVKEVMQNDIPCICEVKIDPLFAEIPRAVTRLDEYGKPYSAPLDDLFPFLTKEDRDKWRL